MSLQAFITCVYSPTVFSSKVCEFNLQGNFLSFEDSLFHTKKVLNIGGNPVSLVTPKVMGILNVTPDSFYQGSRVNQEKSLLAQAEKMLADGAFALDIGGYSSRPGADHISPKEEANRVVNAVQILTREFPDAPLSIDTFRASVAEQALDAGAAIINDISGGELDQNMFALIADRQVPYILMHMRGTPQTMKSQTHYEDLIKEITLYFQEKCHLLTNMGVKDIVLGPGFGFAKTISQNYELLRNLGYFKSLNLPLLAGVSRKSMIYKKLEIQPEDALNGTTALHMIALMNGASILRVHDVKEAVEAVQLFKYTYP